MGNYPSIEYHCNNNECPNYDMPGEGYIEFVNGETTCYQCKEDCVVVDMEEGSDMECDDSDESDLSDLSNSYMEVCVDDNVCTMC